MPNLCSNHLTITGPEADVKAFADAVEGAESICDALLPMPEELKGTSTNRNDPDEGLDPLRAKYGAADWYEWAQKNWGTKWGDYDTDLAGRQDGLVQYVYTTAWGPLDAGLVNISAQFPTLDFTCVYEEGGMCLLGAYRCVEGKIIAQSAIGDDEWPDLTTKDGEEDWDTYWDALNDLRDRVISDVEVVTA